MSDHDRSPAWSWVAWVFLAGPAFAQIGLLIAAIVGRFGYPYDLEWMEGGMLQHAQRISNGDGIYGPPSVDFIPYLYTPLYPGLLAVLGSIFELGYPLGRAISILSLVGIAVTTVVITMGGARGATRAMKACGLAGGIYAIGLFAAGYPYVDGWYDLVRGDTLFLLMITAGLALTYSSARTGRGFGGHATTAAAAAVLALSFFCKQTGVVYVWAGGMIVLAVNYRRFPVYFLVSTAIGLGGRLLLQNATDGWFWTYAYRVHQAHDWNPDRYFLSFENIARHLPAVTILVQLAFVVVLATWFVRRRLARPAKTFLVWFFLYLVSIQVGALGWGTEFAHFNAYMPALLHGAIAAGCALPAIASCVPLLLIPDPAPPRPGEEPRWNADSSDKTAPISANAAIAALERLRRAELLGQVAAVVVALGLGVQCLLAWWHPSKYIPKESDRKAGDALIARIKKIDGPVWIPSHPWYAHLAGKEMFVHRMGIKDVSVRKPRPIVDLQRALEEHWFAAIILDNRDIQSAGETTASMLARTYQMDDTLPKSERPRTYSGAQVHPESIWVPIGPPRMPEGARVVFDFERPGTWKTGWTVTGDAWGTGPVDHKLPTQGLVRRAGGFRWLTSMHGGDEATGTVTTPPFTVDLPTLSLRLGGGTDRGLRVEVLSGGMVMRTLRPPDPDSERFRDVTIDVSNLIGNEVQLRLVDEAKGAWGHLNVDEVWLVP